MLNIEALDKVIAMVVVLLALSLFVQALQGWLKKIFKIKSLQIEQSLVHLYHYALNKDVMESLNKRMDHLPLLRYMTGRDHPATRDTQVSALYNGVMTEFKKVGRLTGRGKLMLDSISKSDLLKFMGRMPVAGIIAQQFPDSARKFGEMRAHVTNLLKVLTEIKTQYQNVLSSPEFERIEKVLTPFLTDVDKFLSGTSSDSGVILDDITKLREINPEEVRKLLEDLPGRIDVIKADVNANTTLTPSVKAEIAQTLENMDKAAIKLLSGVDSVLAGFKHIHELKSSVETWYDTVMQSFEERYTRSMKTWTIIISAFVVIMMNANIVNIYRDISSSETKRAAFLQQVERLRAANTNPAASTAVTNPAAPAPSPGSTPTATPTPSTAQNATVTPESFWKEGKEVINANVDYLTSIGLDGPGWITAKLPGFWDDIRVHKKYRDSAWRALRAILGWFIMTMLLSVGAPFWQDALESLFGLKNKLRQQTGTKNVEEKSGEGQTRAA
ncbi:MAG: hypothetical protein ICV60_00135 [Pyrinomonadaceae bacterium]|nr:hypothetical protein [Pyrinomonadaceae bacterium]